MIWKKPVNGPNQVRRLNIDGDGQGDLAGHGGEQRAVFVYQAESYQYWQEELGRDDFTYGQFGENFTVQGLADDQPGRLPPGGALLVADGQGQDQRPQRRGGVDDPGRP